MTEIYDIIKNMGSELVTDKTFNGMIKDFRLIMKIILKDIQAIEIMTPHDRDNGNYDTIFYKVSKINRFYIPRLYWEEKESIKLELLEKHIEKCNNEIIRTFGFSRDLYEIWNVLLDIKFYGLVKNIKATEFDLSHGYHNNVLSGYYSCSNFDCRMLGCCEGDDNDMMYGFKQRNIRKELTVYITFYHHVFTTKRKRILWNMLSLYLKNPNKPNKYNDLYRTRIKSKSNHSRY